MSIRRRTTVHDVASLRVHPDGTRVQNTQAKSDGSTTAPRPRRGRNVVRDAKGNWIASDAGGSAFIRDIIVGSKRKEQGNGDSDEDLALGYDEGEGEGEGEFGSRKPLKDSRAKRRKTFYSDFSFLEDCSPRAGPNRSVSTSLPSSTVETDMGLPSSDFLKSIHYFASEFYHSKDILYNAGKVSRAERKARRSSRRQSEDNSETEKINVSASDSSNEEESGEPEKSSEREGSTPEVVQTRGKRRMKKEYDPLRKDMYRAFDGTALMAIGVLVQEHILELLDRKPPEGWEEEMAVYETRENKMNQDGRVVAGGKRRRRNGRQEDVETRYTSDTEVHEDSGSGTTISLNEDD